MRWMKRRPVAGLVLIALGIGLFASQRNVAYGLAMLVVWGAPGLAVLVGRPWGRLAGLAVSGIGLVFTVFVASQANIGQGRDLAELFFADAAGHFQWYNVFFESVAFALGFALSAALLITPFTTPANRG